MTNDGTMIISVSATFSQIETPAREESGNKNRSNYIIHRVSSINVVYATLPPYTHTQTRAQRTTTSLVIIYEVTQSRIFRKVPCKSWLLAEGSRSPASSSRSLLGTSSSRRRALGLPFGRRNRNKIKTERRWNNVKSRVLSSYFLK